MLSSWTMVDLRFRSLPTEYEASGKADFVICHLNGNRLLSDLFTLRS